jgi:hypothetical protein
MRRHVLVAGLAVVCGACVVAVQRLDLGHRALAPCLGAAGVDLSAVELADNRCEDHADLALGWCFDCAADVLSTADCSARDGLVDAGNVAQSCALRWGTPWKR